MLLPASSNVTMGSAEALLAAAQDLGVTSPKRLTAVVEGYRAITAAAKNSPNPDTAVLEAVAAGNISAESLRQITAQAVTERLVNEHLAGLGQKANRTFVDRFYEELADGAADEILDGLRPAFDKTAAAITAALRLVDISSSAESLVATASPEQLTAWRSLPKLLNHLNTIAAVATRFGMFGTFPMVEDPRDKDVMLRNGELAWMRDESVFCCGGDFRQTSIAFQQPNRIGDVRTSPWLRVPMKLNSVSEARERVRSYAEAAWTAVESGRGKTGRIINGQHVYDTRRNPFAQPTARL